MTASDLKQLAILYGAKTVRDLAVKMFPQGAVIACKKCQLRVHATALEIARYLRDGWPHTNCSFGVTVEG